MRRLTSIPLHGTRDCEPAPLPGQARRFDGLALMALAAVAGLWAAGCGTARDPAVPVRIEVFHGKKPCAGAVVVFIPEDATRAEKYKPNTIVKEDGSAELSTYRDGDGAPPGKYKVTVEWYRTQRAFGQERQVGKELLNHRYSNVSTTPLSFEVKPSNGTPQTIRIELK